MRKLQLLFVPFEIAKTAKQKGFNEPCLNAFDEQNTSIGSFMLYDDWRKYDNNQERFVLQPLYHQIQEWLKEKGVKVVERPQTGYEIWIKVMNKWVPAHTRNDLNDIILEALKLI